MYNDYIYQRLDLIKMKPIEKIKGHKGKPINAVAWSADSQILASAGSDQTIRLWNREGDSIKVIDAPDYEILDLAWSSDGTLASVGAKKLRLWDSGGNQKKEIDANAYNLVSWSPDSKMIATNTIDFKVNIWNVDGTHIKELSGHTTYVNGLGWSPDGTLFVTASDDAKIRLWDPNSWNEIKVLSEHYESFNCMAWAPDARFAVGSWTYKNKFVRIFNPDGTSTQVLEGEQDKIMSVDWSKDGMMIVSGSSDETALIWKPDGTQLEKLKVGKAVTRVAISPDSQLLAVASWDDEILLYDLTEIKE